ncbi:2-hydroxychromene-2-carboxylate isomerase [Hyphomonas sediminis]|uniref:2-hydroxychromene-2-carboxylate isomerase n=1 Tax=Hyphomonas sediminis TaxID=2866160 RepID=UPI001CED634C|nr:DsbA family protein [Hyphomonas sediminis]
MSLKTLIASHVTQYVTGESRQMKLRANAERKRQKEGRVHQAEYFHVAGDPYSHLVLQVLPALQARYALKVKPMLAPPPRDWAAPERQKLEDYSREDAARLAARAGLSFADPGSQPSSERLAAAEAALGALLDAPDFAQRALAISEALWTGAPLPAGGAAPVAALAEADAAREKLGHYLGGMIHYEGEWYWGVDRLHYLERRQRELGAQKAGAPDAFLFDPPESPRAGADVAAGKGKELHYYLSFRSPYTYIVAERVKALAEAYGAELKLRFVLPMVMRGLPVPRMKGMYITKDVAREARRMGIPFGKIADPVGTPVERGYSILPMAMEEGVGFEFCHSFLKGVWAEGIDAGSDDGLKQIVERAGLDWSRARGLIGGDHWRAEAEANRAEMMGLGIWGVPSFRVGEVATWGQDRMWIIEDALKG